jgi:hypothetical protein
MKKLVTEQNKSIRGKGKKEANRGAKHFQWRTTNEELNAMLETVRSKKRYHWVECLVLWCTVKLLES